MAVRRIVLTLMAVIAVMGWAVISLLINTVELVIDLARLI